MSMFDDYDEQAVKKAKQSAAAAVNGDQLSDDTHSSQGNPSDSAEDSDTSRLFV
jgi:hypothetical protein